MMAGRRIFITLAWLASLLVAAPAHSEPTPNAPGNVVPLARAAKPTDTGDWYGWKLMIGDLTLAGIGYVSFQAESAPGVVLSTTASLFLGPILHSRNGHLRSIPRSLALRAALPIAFGIAGYSLNGCVEHEAPCGPEIAVATLEGALLGAAVAAVIDWTMLSDRRPRRPPAAGEAGPRPRAGRRWSPGRATPR